MSRDESNLSPYLSARSRLPLCLPEDASVEMALAPESPKIEQQSQKTLVVELVSLRPIEKFRRAVAKMPRVSVVPISYFRKCSITTSSMAVLKS